MIFYPLLKEVSFPVRSSFFGIGQFISILTHKRGNQMRGKIIIISILIALLLSSGNLAGKAYADAILFPWILKSNTASTLISVVNTGGLPYVGYSENGLPLLLHYDYRYKASTANGDTEQCNEYDFNRPTSSNDIVSFDASGIMGDGKALFNDSGPYNDQGFLLSALIAAPRRGFLIVDNNTPLINQLEQNGDGTLYGEALIIDTEVGMTWGYTAYNARFEGATAPAYDQVSFKDGRDYQGEVIGATEAGRTVILPPSEFSTKFYVTPIGMMNGQRDGDINTKVFLSYGDQYSAGSFDGGMFLNDEQPISFTTKKNVVCTTALRLDELIPSAAYAVFTGPGGQGWAYIKTEEGNVEGNQNQSSQAVIGKLEWNIFAQSVAIDLSKTADCISCKDKCISDCSTIGKKPDYKCELTCGKKCQKLCIVKKSEETWPGNFTWIRSGESLPY